MLNDSIENSAAAQPEPAKPKGKPRATKKTKPVKNASPARKAAGKPKGDRANKKVEVVALMKRAKGATLAEIMVATGWQAHGARLRQHPRQQGRGEYRVVQERRRRADVQDREIAQATRRPNAASATRQGTVSRTDEMPIKRPDHRVPDNAGHTHLE